MRYECDMCGACCRHLIIEVDELDLIREPRLIAVSEPMRLPEGEVLVEEDEDGEEVLYKEQVPGYGAGAMLACGEACPMLGEDNACSIYLTRPTGCVALRAGSWQCQMAREAAKLPPLEPSRRTPLTLTEIH